MKALDIVKEDRKKLVEKIVDGLNSKGMNWFQEWSDLASPQNGINGVLYKGGNRVKLGTIALEKGFKDPRWATLKQLKEQGYTLKPNATSVLCEYWKFIEKENKENPENKEIVPMVNFFKVYNFAEVLDKDGKELEFKIQERKKDNELQEILSKLEKSSKCIIEYLPQNQAFYNPNKDIIVMPSPDLFKNDLGQIGTLLHEMAHSTGHKDRLNRNIYNQFGTPEYAKEELRAEISSMFIQNELGIKTQERDFNNNQAYIQSWIEVLRSDPNEIYRASADAEKISDYIINEYTEIEKLYEHELKEKEENKSKVIEIKSPIDEKTKEKEKETEIER